MCQKALYQKSKSIIFYCKLIVIHWLSLKGDEMTQEQYEQIIKKINYLELVVSTDCGCFVRECVSDVKSAVLAVNPNK